MKHPLAAFSVSVSQYLSLPTLIAAHSSVVLGRNTAGNISAYARNSILSFALKYEHSASTR